MKKELYFPSADDLTQIHACIWKPEGKPVAILQIAHGMKEYIERYEGFAEYLNAHGILVLGNDHLGHGRSVSGEDAYGYFSRKLGPDDVLADMHTLRLCTQKCHPGIPYFIMGHSMGSAFARAYITRCSEGLAGAIIMGAFTKAPVAVSFGKFLCRSNACLRGWKYHSKMMDRLVCGSFNKSVSNPATDNDWLCHDETVNRAYENDPLVHHHFTLNAYYTMFAALSEGEKAEKIRNIRSDLPILLVSGGDDPVGHMGKDIPRIAHWYEIDGLTNVSYRLFPGDRHEILNERDNDKVYKCLEEWIRAHI